MVIMASPINSTVETVTYPTLENLLAAETPDVPVGKIIEDENNARILLEQAVKVDEIISNSNFKLNELFSSMHVNLILIGLFSTLSIIFLSTSLAALPATSIGLITYGIVLVSIGALCLSINILNVVCAVQKNKKINTTNKTRNDQLNPYLTMLNNLLSLESIPKTITAIVQDLSTKKAEIRLLLKNPWILNHHIGDLLSENHKKYYEKKIDQLKQEIEVNSLKITQNQNTIQTSEKIQKIQKFTQNIETLCTENHDEALSYLMLTEMKEFINADKTIKKITYTINNSENLGLTKITENKSKIAQNKNAIFIINEDVVKFSNKNQLDDNPSKKEMQNAQIDTQIQAAKELQKKYQNILSTPLKTDDQKPA